MEYEVEFLFTTGDDFGFWRLHFSPFTVLVKTKHERKEFVDEKGRDRRTQNRVTLWVSYQKGQWDQIGTFHHEDYTGAFRCAFNSVVRLASTQRNVCPIWGNRNEMDQFPL